MKPEDKLAIGWTLIIGAIIILATALSCEAGEFTADERSVYHVGCSAAFGAAAHTIAYHEIAQFDAVDRVLFGGIVGALPGLIKETAMDGWFDAGDMTFNLVGSFGGALLSEWVNAKFGLSAQERWALVADNDTVMVAYTKAW